MPLHRPTAPRRRTAVAGLVVAAGAALAASATVPAVADDVPATSWTPVVVAHRGASGDRPEHTLASYRLAIELGADFIEPDLVSTSDGVLVARHENEISGTTDIAERPEFADRRTTKVVDGVELTGWFTEDLTLAELKTLRAKERLPDLRPRNTAFDGIEEIPTFEEVLAFARAEKVGVFPETKHPSYFDAIGLSLEEPLVAALEAVDWDDDADPVFIQSFELANLRELDGMVDVPLVHLVGGSGAPWDLVAAADPRTWSDLLTPEGLDQLATFVDGIGPDKGRIVPRDATGSLLEPTTLVRDAHRAGLVVYPYTFRNENTFLPADLRLGDPASPLYSQAVGDAAAEYRLFFGLGVDGLFSDHPGTALAVRSALGYRPVEFNRWVHRR